ncbi:hypothetical protein POM88_047855 [Heracleum sosnowskyi]|uniref:Transposase-associated domain-containing protein n=1 Tax=Heracleum sosnowskyi TaxID=360622 RepID=A0AAD8GUN5_9APIA|nr:hypothetical protein POM88_047855 [Heracleum sosnowskyi]
MDRHTWMYKISRATQDYVDGVEKFIECVEGNLKKKREQGNEDKITCPCHDCYNLKNYPSVATVRDHLFRRGFMADYTKWIWHGEGIHSEKSKTYDGNRGSIGESMPTNKEDDAENDRMNEMIEDVEELLVHQPKMLENLVDDSKKLLYPGCNDQFTRYQSCVAYKKILFVTSILMAGSSGSNVDFAGFEKVLCKSMVRNLLPLVRKCKALKYDLGDLKNVLGDQFDAIEERLEKMSFRVGILADRWLNEMEQFRLELVYLERDTGVISLGGCGDHPKVLIATPRTTDKIREKLNALVVEEIEEEPVVRAGSMRLLNAVRVVGDALSGWAKSEFK